MKLLNITGKILSVARFVPGPHTPFMGVAGLIVDAAETQFGAGQGGKKKEWSEALGAEIWDVFYKQGVELPIPRTSLGQLIEEVVVLKNASGEFGHGPEAPQLKNTESRTAWPVQIRGVAEFTGPSPFVD